jgi:hypothetical protein
MATLLPLALLWLGGVDAPATIKIGEACPAPQGQDIVVCGAPDRNSAFRIDPSVLAVGREKNDPGIVASNRDPAADTPCPSYGLKLCQGRDTVPILAIARVAARSAALAISGEDWREPLRTRPDDYSIYREAKAKEERQVSARRVRVGLSARPK